MGRRTELTCCIDGEGEPVLFVHGAHFADSFLPLVAEAPLQRYRRITYHRRGYGGSPAHTGAFSIEQTADDALALLDQIGIGRAHVVGHSSGGTVALQMALAAPSMVHSLGLLEPALAMVPSRTGFLEAIAPAKAIYASGRSGAAVDAFLSLIAGPDWRAQFAQRIPGSPEQVERDAATFFEVEQPAVFAWSFDAAKARVVRQPLLYVIGTESGPFSKEGKELCQAWMPQTEIFTVAGATHTLHQQRPEWSAAVARGLSEFFGRHPL